MRTTINVSKISHTKDLFLEKIPHGVLREGKADCFSVLHFLSNVPLCLQALLEVVNDLFEEQTDLEKIVKKIMHRAQTLLKCERCSVLLLEDIESPVSYPLLSTWSQRLGGRSLSAIKLASRVFFQEEGRFFPLDVSLLILSSPWKLNPLSGWGP